MLVVMWRRARRPGHADPRTWRPWNVTLTNAADRRVIRFHVGLEQHRQPYERVAAPLVVANGPFGSGRRFDEPLRLHASLESGQTPAGRYRAFLRRPPIAAFSFGRQPPLVAVRPQRTHEYEGRS